MDPPLAVAFRWRPITIGEVFEGSRVLYSCRQLYNLDPSVEKSYILKLEMSHFRFDFDMLPPAAAADCRCQPGDKIT